MFSFEKGRCPGILPGMCGPGQRPPGAPKKPCGSEKKEERREEKKDCGREDKKPDREKECKKHQEGAPERKEPPGKGGKRDDRPGSGGHGHGPCVNNCSVGCNPPSCSDLLRFALWSSGFFRCSGRGKSGWHHRKGGSGFC